MAQNPVLLETRGLCKRFGGVQAVSEVDFTLRSGEVHALLGENGAGKSTFVKMLCGVVKKDKGEILFDGRPVRIERPQDAKDLGIVSVFQELSLLPEMTVAENIYLGSEPRGRLGLIDFQRMHGMCRALLEDYGISLDAAQMVGRLPLAKQQLVEIAKALARDTRLVILDEATSALSSELVDLLFSIVRRLRSEGKAVVFISHRMHEIEQIADRATIFRDARKVVSFAWGELSNEEITRRIAGRSIGEIFPPQSEASAGETLLEVRNLSSPGMLKDVNLRVRRGEIVGIAGLAGHGQRELLKAMFGALPNCTGRFIGPGGKPLRLKSPRDAMRSGIMLVAEDRKTEGLLLGLSVEENLSLMILNRLTRCGLMSAKKERENARAQIERLRIRVSSPLQSAESLSGGNQQKVVVGKCTAMDFDLLLLADPTRGIDVGTKSEMYQLIADMAGNGVGVVFYSTDLSELVGMCSRVLVFVEGRVAVELAGEAISENAIVNNILGIA